MNRILLSTLKRKVTLKLKQSKAKTKQKAVGYVTVGLRDTNAPMASHP